MPALHDHITRDAHDAARAEIRLHLNQYNRRLIEDAQAAITRAFSELATGEEVNGLVVGREAAQSVIRGYLALDGPHAAIEAGSTAEEN